MDHGGGIDIIQGIVLMLICAFGGGLLAKRLGVSVIIGYLVGGILIGPFTPGPIGDPHVAEQMAEIGVILLMFGVGLHFSLRDLNKVKAVALPGAIIQSALTTLATAGIAVWLWDWEFKSGIVLGIAVSVASTVVLLRTLDARGIVESSPGRSAVGWLVVEDILSVLALVVLPLIATTTVQHDELLSQDSPVLAANASLLETIGVTIVSLAILFGIIFGIGPRVVSWALRQVDQEGESELFTLSVIVIAMGVAGLANYGFGVSFALGAFFAGVVVGGSSSHVRAARDVVPLRDIFGILFFVSIGMLFDPATIWKHTGALIVVSVLVIVVKPVLTAAITIMLRQPMNLTTTLSPALGQIGEFSFIVAVVGRELDLLPETASQLLVGAAIISIAVNPVLMSIGDRLGRRFGAEPIATDSAPAASESVAHAS